MIKERKENEEFMWGVTYRLSKAGERIRRMEWKWKKKFARWKEKQDNKEIS